MILRVDDTKWKARSKLFRDFIQHQIDAGVLVPVEPDYQAMGREIWALGETADYSIEPSARHLSVLGQLVFKAGIGGSDG